MIVSQPYRHLYCKRILVITPLCDDPRLMIRPPALYPAVQCLSCPARSIWAEMPLLKSLILLKVSDASSNDIWMILLEACYYRAYCFIQTFIHITNTGSIVRYLSVSTNEYRLLLINMVSRSRGDVLVKLSHFTQHKSNATSLITAKHMFNSICNRISRIRHA